MAMPLQGIRIIDWTAFQQGPVATQLLGDMGAEVIKVEERIAGDPARGMMKVFNLHAGIEGNRNFYFETNNRNKKSIAIDLKKPRGKEIIYQLVAKSDVFVQNFRKGVAGRLGLDYETLAKHNPKLIYASASGYGPEGPDSGEPSFDLAALARSGFMSAVGEPDMPPLLPLGGIADQMGAIMLSYGILLAIVARERLGIGQEVDASHLGSMMELQGLNVAAALMIGSQFRRQRRLAQGNPLYNYYRCADDKWLCLSMVQPDRQWHDFCQAVGIAQYEHDPRFSNWEERERNSEEMTTILDEVFATKMRAEWMEILKNGGDFIYVALNSVGDLVNDPQAIANKYVDDFDHPTMGPVKVLGLPVRLSKTPGNIRTAAPEHGQHTEEILIDMLGYDWNQIGALRDEEVIL